MPAVVPWPSARGQTTPPRAVPDAAAQPLPYSFARNAVVPVCRQRPPGDCRCLTPRVPASSLTREGAGVESALRRLRTHPTPRPSPPGRAPGPVLHRRRGRLPAADRPACGLRRTGPHHAHRPPAQTVRHNPTQVGPYKQTAPPGHIRAPGSAPLRATRHGPRHHDRAVVSTVPPAAVAPAPPPPQMVGVGSPEVQRPGCPSAVSLVLHRPGGHHYRSGHLAGARSPLLCTPPPPRPGLGSVVVVVSPAARLRQGWVRTPRQGPDEPAQRFPPAHASLRSVAARGRRQTLLRTPAPPRCARTVAPAP